ncbi:hypothetical protein SAMD00019534_055590 [Acytostelium subglobosum LB1]|uniref:hypothetical protein n=1 Tax=Acytostelium subglobosum LB1 TaxID=1410327 RepID=UPI000644EA9A|nr:hypothetical protein SAMD00019534_055590 [Acytostelium subglobosum LB1]GAM22384.1 hypothetical protein SAMD00019534_055590 [Acytostelium subglobosum LB1]|eukprot:XP_012754504.1 hypothetical protein SAMD00019534_055590 [Acytostelium subglobosum LB1]
MRHLHQLHAPGPIYLGNHEPLLKSIGSQENALEFITSIGVLRDCFEVKDMKAVINDTLRQYFSLELLDHINQTLPEYMKNVDWIAEAICTTLSRYLIYIGFKRSRSSTNSNNMAETSAPFVLASINNNNNNKGDLLALLKQVHAHFTVTGLPFSIGDQSMVTAIKCGSPLDVIYFLLDQYDIDVLSNDIDFTIQKIHPSLQSMELIQRLATYPNIRFCIKSLKCLLQAGNFELFRLVELHMQQHQLYIDYPRLLSVLVKLPPETEVTSLITSIIHKHPEELYINPYSRHITSCTQILLNSHARAAIIATTTPTLPSPFTIGDLASSISELKRIPLASQRVELLQQILDSDIISTRYRRPIRGYPMDCAISEGLFELLPVLSIKYPDVQLAHLVDDGYGIVDLLTRDGLTESFKIYITHKAHISSPFLQHARMSFDNLEIIQFLCTNNIYFDIPTSFLKAARSGALGTLKYLTDNRNIKTTTEAMDGAATNGHLHVFEYLNTTRNEGCTEQAFIGAAKNGHLHILEFMFSKFKYDYQRLVSVESSLKMIIEAMDGGHIKMGTNP